MTRVRVRAQVRFDLGDVPHIRSYTGGIRVNVKSELS